MTAFVSAAVEIKCHEWFETYASLARAHTESYATRVTSVTSDEDTRSAIGHALITASSSQITRTRQA